MKNLEKITQSMEAGTKRPHGAKGKPIPIFSTRPIYVNILLPPPPESRCCPYQRKTKEMKQKETPSPSAIERSPRPLSFWLATPVGQRALRLFVWLNSSNPCRISVHNRHDQGIASMHTFWGYGKRRSTGRDRSVRWPAAPYQASRLLG